MPVKSLTNVRKLARRKGRHWFCVRCRSPLRIVSRRKVIHFGPRWPCQRIKLLEDRYREALATNRELNRRAEELARKMEAFL